MTIRELRIRGFRSLRDVTWRPGRLNVLIGANASGKSNLLRALELLQAAAAGDFDKKVLAMGGMGPLLWDGTAEAAEWELEVDPILPEDPYWNPRPTPIEYRLRLEPVPHFAEGRVVQEDLFDFQPSREMKGSHEPFYYLRRGLDFATVWEPNKREMIPLGGQRRATQPMLSDLRASSFIHPVASSFRGYMEEFGIHQYLRTDPDADVRRATVARYEKRLDPEGLNLVNVLATLYNGDRGFEEAVNRNMRAAFGRDFEKLVFGPASDQRINMRLRWQSLNRQMSAADLSDGTLRFLMLNAILENPAPGSLAAIDEPETGLHPHMLPIVAEMARAAAERTQVLLTTHSPDLLDLFPADDPPTVTVARLEDGATRLDALDPEDLKRWLADYRLGEIFRSRGLEAMA